MGTVQVVLGLLKSVLQRPEACDACYAVLALARGGQAQSVVQEGGMPLLMKTLTLHLKDAHIVQQVVSALLCMVQLRDGSALAAQLGALAHMEEVIEAHCDHGAVRRLAFDVVRTLVERGGCSANSVLRSKVTTAALHTMREDAHPSPSLQGACALMAALARQEEGRCVVCMEVKATHANVNCGHMHVCDLCAGRLVACPTCRVVGENIRIYPC